MNYHSNALRKGRFSEVGRIYSITIVCHTRTPIFRQFQAARVAVATMKRLAPSVSTLCFVIMPDQSALVSLFGKTGVNPIMCAEIKVTGFKTTS
jgi:putative transposase